MNQNLTEGIRKNKIDFKRLREQLKQHEGIRHKVYYDTANPPNRTIGVGFNLERDDAPEILKRIGVEWEQVTKYRQPLTDTQIEYLLNININEALTDCYKLISPEAWDAMDEVRQRVVVDMMFNMGYPTFSQFKGTLGHIEKGEYLEASKHMVRSLWYRQVKTRGQVLCTMMATGSDLL